MSLAGLGPVLLLGAGRMGGALLEGWLTQGLEPASIVVVDPEPPEETRALARERGLRLLAAAEAGMAPQIAVLAVKPQVMRAALGALAPALGEATLLVSIAAGQTIANIQTGLGRAAPVVRVMPNTPAAIGHGVSGLVANERVSDAQRRAAEGLMAAVGIAEWVEDEALMDAVTAVSGSGPAYVFLLAECLAEAGAAEGLDPDLALTLARHTVAGAGALLVAEDIPPGRLRQNVTSPGGTTEAALSVLMGEGGFGPLLRRAVAAATKRGKELAG